MQLQPNRQQLGVFPVTPPSRQLCRVFQSVVEWRQTNGRLELQRLGLYLSLGVASQHSDSTAFFLWLLGYVNIWPLGINARFDAIRESAGSSEPNEHLHLWQHRGPIASQQQHGIPGALTGVERLEAAHDWFR